MFGIGQVAVDLRATVGERKFFVSLVRRPECYEKLPGSLLGTKPNLMVAAVYDRREKRKHVANSSAVIDRR